MKKIGIVLLLIAACDFVASQKTQKSNSNCVCVTYYNCLKNNTINKYGISVIDVRLGETRPCQNIMDVCCNKPDIKKPDSNNNPPPKPHVNKGCGYRNRNGIDFRITGDVQNIANEGEFPWMVLVLKNEVNNGNSSLLYKCGGSLINSRVVLTAAHCIGSFAPTDVVIRAGDWDTSTTKERLPYQDRKVNAIITHPEYDQSYLGYDFALVILEKPFKLDKNVEVVCLPEKDEEINSKDCYVTGWGKNKFGEEGLFSSILKAVKLPIVPSNECETRLRTTRLSEYFELHSSFICAGGVPGFDACEGDGGSPLVCPMKGSSDRYVQAGVVAWGIGCNDDIPGAYASVPKARSWIDQTLKEYNIDSSSYVPK